MSDGNKTPSLFGTRQLAFALAAVLVMPAPAPAAEPHPLEVADTSSPRATLRSFRESADEVYAAIRGGAERYRLYDELGPAVNRTFSCLDLSEVPPALKQYAAAEAAVCLKEVLDRIDLPPDSEIPDAAEMRALAEAGAPARWTVPHTEITIALVEEGSRKGAFLFSPDTVAQAKEFYHRAKDLPYKPGASEGFYDWYLSEPGWMIPVAWIHSLPAWTRTTVLDQTIWQWAGLIVTLILGALVMFFGYVIGRRRAEKQRSNVLRYFVTLWFPIMAMLVPLAVKYFAVEQLRIRGAALPFVTMTLDVLFLIAVTVVLFGAGGRIAEVIIASPRIHPKGIDAQLIRLGFRVLGIVAAVVVLLEGGRQLGFSVTTLLAGAGVGGLTVALAAQDSLKNLFGSMMIVLDKPYRVGERIIAKGYDGVVEEIGLRSTKIRLLTGHQATIPNEEMARIDVENVGRRPHIRRIQDISLAFDTPPDKVEEAIRIVRTAVEDHEGKLPDFPPRVYFNEFSRDALNLRMILWFHPPAYWDFLAWSEKLNLQILQEFAAAGIRMAVPAMTARVTADGEPGGPLGPSAPPAV